MGIQKLLKIMIAFRVWISGTQQFSCELKNSITIIPTCDKFLKHSFANALLLFCRNSKVKKIPFYVVFLA
jgi:hypothetical protein